MEQVICFGDPVPESFVDSTIYGNDVFYIPDGGTSPNKTVLWKVPDSSVGLIFQGMGIMQGDEIPLLRANILNEIGQTVSRKRSGSLPIFKANGAFRSIQRSDITVQISGNRSGNLPNFEDVNAGLTGLYSFPTKVWDAKSLEFGNLPDQLKNEFFGVILFYYRWLPAYNQPNPELGAGTTGAAAFGTASDEWSEDIITRTGEEALVMGTLREIYRRFYDPEDYNFYDQRYQRAKRQFRIRHKLNPNLPGDGVRLRPGTRIVRTALQ